MNVEFEPYKNKHTGERVFIVANGPSLAETDLSLLEGEISIGMNRIALIYDKHPSWRPSYYLFSSTNVKHDDWGDAWTSSVREAASEERTTSFIASMFKPWIDPDEEQSRIKWFSSMSEKKPSSNGEIDPSCFSTDLVERIDKSGTTANLALQLAYWMDFSEICFVGADLGWTKDEGSRNDPNHFDESYRANIPNPDKANKQMRNVHLLALKHLEAKNVKIYNASKKTVLDSYPIIELEPYVRDRKVIRRERDENQAKMFWQRFD